MAGTETRQSAKERQLEIDRSRRRWLAFFSLATGFGVLLLAGMMWTTQDTDRDDADNGPTVQDTRGNTD